MVPSKLPTYMFLSEVIEYLPCEVVSYINFKVDNKNQLVGRLTPYVREAMLIMLSKFSGFGV